MALATAETTQICFLLRDLGVPLCQPPILLCDNISALHMIINPIFYARTKHVEVDYHFVREKVALGHLVTRFVPSKAQLVDVFTKSLL